MAPPSTLVEQVELSCENYKSFRQFTSQVTGRGLSVPEDNLLFFTYRVYGNDITRILVSVGTCKPACLPTSTKDTTCSESLLDSDMATLNLTDPPANALPESPRSASTSSPVDDFLDSSSHLVEYLFTDAYYRRQGYGGQTLKAMESHCHSLNPSAPVKLWAASKALPFFQRYHYEQAALGPQENCQGINIFRTLYPMIKSPDTIGLPCLPKASQPKNKNRRRKRQVQLTPFVF